MQPVSSVIRTHLWRTKGESEKLYFHSLLLRDASFSAARIPGIQHFWVNVVFDATHRLSIPPTTFTVDAISHLSFADVEARAQAQRSPQYHEFCALFEPLLYSRVALDVTQSVFVAPPEMRAAGGQRARLLKRMSVLQRAEGLTADAFQRTWKQEHGPRVVSQGAGLRGYFQDEVVAVKEEYGEIESSCDGLTELWFEDPAAMERLLPEKSLSAVTGNAARIIGGISTFLVREFQLF